MFLGVLTKMIKSKKAAHSFSAINFILNVIAVIIIVFGLRAIVENTNAGIMYSGNQEYLIKLNYILFSDDGILPDHYTIDLNSYEQNLDKININDVGMRFNLRYADNDLNFYFNENFYEINYPLRNFDTFFYFSQKKPVLVINNSEKYFGHLEINYIFKKEKAPKFVNKNG